EPAMARVLAAEEEAAVTVHRGRCGLQAQTRDLLVQRGVPVAEVGGAGVDPSARRDLDAVRAPADAAARLQHGDVPAGPAEVGGRREPGQPGADHNDFHDLAERHVATIAIRSINPSGVGATTKSSNVSSTPWWRAIALSTLVASSESPPRAKKSE